MSEVDDAAPQADVIAADEFQQRAIEAVEGKHGIIVAESGMDLTMWINGFIIDITYPKNSMKIEITKAIERRRKEIERLNLLRGDIETLIEDAKNAESGKPSMPEVAYNEFRRAIEAELIDLELARIVGRNENGIGGQIGIPSHWAIVKVE